MNAAKVVESYSRSHLWFRKLSAACHSRLKISQLGECLHVKLGFHTDFVPHGPEAHVDDRVKVLELRIAHCQILQIKVLLSARGVDCTAYKRVIPLQLDEHRLHTLVYSILALAHQVCHRLVQLNSLRLSGQEGGSDIFIKSGRCQRGILQRTHLG